MTDREQYAPGPASGAQVRKDRVQKGEDKWTLILVRELRHSPEKVWQALTDPAHLRESTLPRCLSTAISGGNSKPLVAAPA
jgi:hypothetical protein